MFGNKKHGDIPLGPQQEKPKEKINSNLHVMPGDFYGGADPIIYHDQKNNTEIVEKKVLPHPVIPKKVTLPQPPQSPQQQSVRKQEIPREKNNKKLFIILGIVFFVIVVSLVSWYYIASNPSEPPNIKQEVEQKNITKEKQIEKENIEPIKDTTQNDDQELEKVIPNPKSLEEIPLILPRIIAAKSLDLDNDGLTDREEELFSSDSGVIDTDQDGYPDLLEVVNLYNPAGVAPVKLIDSGFVREYVNPTWQYRVYYPGSWDVASVDNTGNQILFSAGTGDFIEIRSFNMKSGELFTDWFSRMLPNESFTNLKEIKNRFNIEGLTRNDKLVSFFIEGNNVFVIIYNVGSGNDLLYPIVQEMMTQSFRASRSSNTIPDQEIIPKEATSTQQVSQN